MFLNVLTEDNKFYMFEIVLERKFNYTKNKFKEIVTNKTLLNETLPEDLKA
jgi:hypothetical protein